jgi:hypothetical protein
MNAYSYETNVWLALSLRPLRALGEGQKSESAGSEALAASGF